MAAWVRTLCLAKQRQVLALVQKADQLLDLVRWAREVMCVYAHICICIYIYIYIYVCVCVYRTEHFIWLVGRGYGGGYSRGRYSRWNCPSSNGWYLDGSRHAAIPNNGM